MKNLSKELFTRITGINADEAPNAYIAWMEEQITEQQEIRENILKCEEDIAKVMDREDMFHG